MANTPQTERDPERKRAHRAPAQPARRPASRKPIRKKRPPGSAPLPRSGPVKRPQSRSNPRPKDAQDTQHVTDIQETRRAHRSPPVYTPAESPRYPKILPMPSLEDKESFDTTPPDEYRRGALDLPCLLLVLMITAIGLIMMFSASYASSLKETGDSTYFLFRQGIFALAGVAIMYVVSLMNYQAFRGLSVVIVIVAVVLLVLVLFLGKDVKGAKRWIDLGFTTFQPSEIAKLGVILLFSAMISQYRERMKTFRYGIVPFVVILGIISGLMIMEPHLSGTILIVGVGAALMFVGGVQWGYFAGVLGIGGIGAYILFTTMPHAIDRISVWRDPFIDPSGKGFQAIQSLYAIGSGGMFGLGLGKSRQKFLYLPEEHNDFVFAIVCEELGFIGALIVMLLFIVLILRCYWIAVHARDRFGSLIVTGITTLLAMQTFLNMAVVTNLIPVTGVSMPFFSYGGTSLVVQLAEMGIVLAVSRSIPARETG